jgi:hypothetical protein
VHGYREFKTITLEIALCAPLRFRHIIRSDYLTQTRDLQEYKAKKLRVVTSDDHSSVDRVLTLLAAVCG